MRERIRVSKASEEKNRVQFKNAEDDSVKNRCRPNRESKNKTLKIYKYGLGVSGGDLICATSQSMHKYGSSGNR